MEAKANRAVIGKEGLKSMLMILCVGLQREAWARVGILRLAWCRVEQARETVQVK